MNQPPLIIPFQTEIYVTNNKNTPDKNCVRISPNYENVEYVSYLGGRMEPPPLFLSAAMASRNPPAFSFAGVFSPCHTNAGAAGAIPLAIPHSARPMDGYKICADPRGKPIPQNFYGGEQLPRLRE